MFRKKLVAWSVAVLGVCLVADSAAACTEPCVGAGVVVTEFSQPTGDGGVNGVLIFDEFGQGPASNKFCDGAGTVAVGSPCSHIGACGGGRCIDKPVCDAGGDRS
jgi:hypothetical protein